MIKEKKINVDLINRLLPKCNNMKTLLYAYNNTNGVEKLALSTLYKKMRQNKISTSFEIGGNVKKVRSTLEDMIFSGLSIGKRLYTYNKPAIRKFLGNKCACCGITLGLEIDHIDNNSSNTQIRNLQLLCGTCHNIKHQY